MLRLCKKFPPKAKQSTGVNTAWIQPSHGEKCVNTLEFLSLRTPSKTLLTWREDKAEDTRWLTCWNEQGVPLFDGALVAHVDLVAKEHLVLVGWGAPPLEQSQVCRRGRNKVEDLLALHKQKAFNHSGTVSHAGTDLKRGSFFTHPQDMVPNWGAAKVNVKVCVTVLHPHQAVLLHVGPLKHRLFRPEVFHPGQFAHDLWCFHQVWESGRNFTESSEPLREICYPPYFTN